MAAARPAAARAAADMPFTISVNISLGASRDITAAELAAVSEAFNSFTFRLSFNDGPEIARDRVVVEREPNGLIKRTREKPIHGRTVRLEIKPK